MVGVEGALLELSAEFADLEVSVVEVQLVELASPSEVVQVGAVCQEVVAEPHAPPSTEEAPKLLGLMIRYPFFVLRGPPEFAVVRLPDNLVSAIRILGFSSFCVFYSPHLPSPGTTVRI